MYSMPKKHSEASIRCILFLAILGLFLYPILHGNFYYPDDYYRSATGDISCTQTGRFLAQLIFIILNASNISYDLSPTLQILAIIILSFSLSFLSLKWRLNRTSSALSLSFIVCTPFFLQNLSYHSDSLNMSIALSCIMWFFIFDNKPIPPYKKIFFRSILILSALNLYQPTLNAFFIFLITESLFILHDKTTKDSIQSFIMNALYLPIPLIVYKCEVIFRKDESYASLHAQFTHNLFIILNNIRKLLKYAFLEFGIHGGSLEILLGCFLFIALINLLYIFYKKGKFPYLALTLCYISLAICSLAGFLALLRYPVFDMRVFIANGAFLSLFMLFFIGKEASFHKNPVKIILASWVLLIQMTFSTQWGSAIAAQTELNEAIASNIVNDTYILSKQHPVFIRIEAQHKTVNNITTIAAQTDDGILDIPVPFITKKIWHARRAIFDHNVIYDPLGEFILKKHDLQDNATYFRSIDESPQFPFALAQSIYEHCSYEAMRSNRYYNIYKKGSYILVDFSHKCNE
ncbi:glucosyltransferase domain-containing protein [Bombella saccharophila]